MSQNPYDTPAHPGNSTTAVLGTRTVAIRRIDIASAGMILGALYAVLGLLVGGLFSLFAILGIAMGGGGGDAAMGGIITGVGALLFFPLMYGVGGFIFGIITALLYNLVAGIVGGLKFDLEG